MSPREANARLLSLLETLDFDPELDANDVDAYGMDAATRKRLKVKNLHKHPSQKKVRKPHSNRVPSGLSNIGHQMKSRGR